MTSTTTRRQLLSLATSAAAYAGGAAIVGGGIALASEAHGATLSRGAWDRATVNMERIKAAYHEADRRLVAASIKADRIRPPESMVPHRELQIGDKRWQLWATDPDEHEQKWHEGEGKWWWGTPESKQRRAEAFAKLREWQRLDRAADDRYSVTRLNDECDAASEAWCDAITVVMDTPAPDLPALRWKLGEVFPQGEGGSTPSWSADYVAQTLRDIDRLLGGVA